MRIRSFQSLLVILLVLFSTGTLAQQATRKKKTVKTQKQTNINPSFRIIGYFSNWGPVSKIKFDNITCLNFAFIKPMPDGSLAKDSTYDKLYQIVAKARPKKVKVVAAIGGQYTDKTFSQIAKSEATMDKFVNNLVALVDKYQLDGIDLDWEYPQFNTDEPQKMLLLTKKLSAKLRPKKKILSMALHSKPKWGALFLDGLFPLLDYASIMAYDDMEQPSHSSYPYALNSMNYWIVTRKVPREKLNLGVPTYGRNPKVVPPYYKDLIKKGADPNADSFNGIHYNGIGTIRKKVALAMRNVGGVMIWEINGDTDDDKTSLIKAIKDETRRGMPAKTNRGTMKVE